MLDVLFLLNCVCYMLCFKQTEVVADCYALSSFCCLKLKHESVLFECRVFAFLCEAAVKQVVRRYVTMWAYMPMLDFCFYSIDCVTMLTVNPKMEWCRCSHLTTNSCWMSHQSNTTDPDFCSKWFDSVLCGNHMF